MVVWSGWGILVAPLAVAALVGGAMVDKSLDGPLKGFGTPAFAAAAAALTFALSRWLARDEGRVLADRKSEEQVAIDRRDSLFLIPVATWAHIFLGLAIATALSQLFAPRS